MGEDREGQGGRRACQVRTVEFCPGRNLDSWLGSSEGSIINILQYQLEIKPLDFVRETI